MSKLKIGALILIGAFILINPISKTQSVLAATSSDKVPVFTQEGIASWYGPGFQGRKTANGERFNTNDMTAAHKTLPFGTFVRVTNLSNGKTTVVRINDRGPFIKGRIIDLSQAAKNEIGMGGTTQVTIEVINPELEEQEANEEAEESNVPLTLFETSFPLTSKVFVEYLGEPVNAEKLSKEEFNDFFNTAKKIRVKVLTTNTGNAIYQEQNESPSVNYFDVTNRIKFVKGYTLKVANFTDKALAYELVGYLESSNFSTIFIEELISENSTTYTVYVGNYKMNHESKEDRKLLKKMSYSSKLVKIGS